MRQHRHSACNMPRPESLDATTWHTQRERRATAGRYPILQRFVRVKQAQRRRDFQQQL